MADPDDDLLCVARCLRGDASGFEPIVVRYQRVMFALALRMLGDYEDARDATQNAFIRAYAGLDTYDSERRFFTWLYRIVVNECLNFRRARRPTEPLAEGIEEPEEAGPLRLAENVERSARIDAALVKLPEDQRMVLVLRHFAELSYAEIGDVVGVPEKTVKSRLFEARQRLGELLRGQREGR